MVCNGNEFNNYDFDIFDIINSCPVECDLFSADTIVPGVEPAADISNFFIDDVSPIVDTINTASEYIDFSSQCFYSTSSSSTPEFCNFNEFFGDENLSKNSCEFTQRENTTNSNKCKISTSKQLFQNIPACSRTSDRPFILRGTGYERYCKNLSSQGLDINKENLRDTVGGVRDTVGGETTQSALVRDVTTTCYRNNQDNTIECRRKTKHKKIRKKPNRCYHLWDFLNDLLIGRIYPQSTCAAWVDEHEKEFRIIDTKEMAKLWGICKNSKNMTYDKLSRTIRYYCTLDILKKTEGKRLQFKFSKGKMWTKLAQ